MPRSVNKTQSKWCINKHGASKIIDRFETYQQSPRDPPASTAARGPRRGEATSAAPTLPLYLPLTMMCRPRSSRSSPPSNLCVALVELERIWEDRRTRRERSPEGAEVLDELPPRPHRWRTARRAAGKTIGRTAGNLKCFRCIRFFFWKNKNELRIRRLITDRGSTKLNIE
jgi:hypothetical protein